MDLNKLSYSLRCRPFLHYYVPSYAPLSSVNNVSLRKVTVNELIRQMLNRNNMMCECEPTVDPDEGKNIDDVEGRTFSQAALFRGKSNLILKVCSCLGDMCTYTVEEAMTFIKPQTELEETIRSTLLYNERTNPYLDGMKEVVKFEDRNPRREFISICNYSAPGAPMSVTYLRNTSNIKFKFNISVQLLCCILD